MECGCYSSTAYWKDREYKSVQEEPAAGQSETACEIERARTCYHATKQVRLHIKQSYILLLTGMHYSCCKHSLYQLCRE